MKHLITISAALTLVLLLCTTAFAKEHQPSWQEAESLIQQGALDWDPRILHGTLANGMNYLYFDTRQESSYNNQGMNLQLIVHAGSTDEESNQLGVAHMVEHMVFRATEQYPNGARSAFSALGLTQGRSFNAMTNADATRYMVTLDQSTPDSFTKTLGVLQQMMFHASLKANDLTSERPIILEEWRGGLSSRRYINDQKKAIIRVGSAYPERPVIGNQNSIENTPATRIREFYDRWYAPNNMTLVAIGAMDNDAVQDSIESVFAKASFRALPPRKPKDPVLSDTLHIGTLTDPESRVNRIAYLFRFPKVESLNLHHRRERIINYLSKKLLSQQMRRQSDQIELIRRLGATKGEVSPNVSLIAFGSLYDPDNMQPQLRQLLIEIERLRQHGFLKEDFDNVLVDARYTAERNISAAKDRGIFWLAKLTEAATEHRPLPDPKRQNQLTMALLDTITLDDVNDQLRAWLSAPDQVAYLQKAGDNHSQATLTEAMIRQLQDDIRSLELALPFAPKTIAQKSLHVTTQNTPAQLIQRYSKHQVSHWQLANGEQVWLLEAPLENNKIHFRAVHDFGYQNTQWDPTHSQILAQMMAAQTPPQWSDEETQQWQDSFDVRGHWAQDANRRIYRFTASEQSLAAQLAYYQQGQLNSDFNKPLYQGFMENLTRNADSQVKRVSDQFRRAFTQHQYRTPPDTTTELKRFTHVTRDALSQQAKRIRTRPATYFVTARNVESILPQLNQYLSAIPRELSPEPINKPALTPHSEHTRFTRTLAREPRATFRLNGFTPLTWNPQQLALIPHLADEMNARFKAVLRGEKQGIYSLRSDIRYDAEKQGVILSVRFTSDPKRIAELEDSVLQLIHHWSDDLDETWLTSQRAQFLRAEAQRSQQSQTRLNRLQLSLQHYGDPRYLSDVNHLADGFTMATLQSLLASLSWPSLTTGILLPQNED